MDIKMSSLIQAAVLCLALYYTVILASPVLGALLVIFCIVFFYGLRSRKNTLLIANFLFAVAFSAALNGYYADISGTGGNILPSMVLGALGLILFALESQATGVNADELQRI